MKLGRVLPPAVLAVAMATAPAHAYVRTLTNAGKPMYWPSDSIQVLLYAGGPPPFLTRDTLVGAVNAAAATWSTPALSCTSMQLSVVANDLVDAPVANDKVNRITFRTDVWEKKPCDPSIEGDCVLYDTQALALTSVFARTSTGEILDADMELNAVDYKWDDAIVNPPHAVHPAEADLIEDAQNVITHELGHLIGLDHNCYDPSANPNGPPLDNLGQPVPNCATASATVMAATMFASARPGDTSKRDLAQDDINAVCDTYPPGYSGVAGPVPKAGCAFGGSSSGSGAGLGGAGLALLALLRIRARRRR